MKQNYSGVEKQKIAQQKVKRVENHPKLTSIFVTQQATEPEEGPGASAGGAAAGGPLGDVETDPAKDE